MYDNYGKTELGSKKQCYKFACKFHTKLIILIVTITAGFISKNRGFNYNIYDLRFQMF